MADEQLIKPRELPPAADVFADDAIMTDDGVTVGKATPVQIVNAGAPVASQSEAIAGVDNTKRMTPLTVKQVLDDATAPSVARAQAWAESIYAPDPSIPGSRSAKSWATIAEAEANRVIGEADRAEDAAQEAQNAINEAGRIYLSRDAAILALPTLDAGAQRISWKAPYGILSVVRQFGATVIPDMPGWVPVNATPFHWGASGSGITSDSAAIQAYANYCTVVGRPRDIILPAGFIYKISTPVVINYSGSRAGAVHALGAILPDPGIGRAFSIINGQGGDFRLWVQNGGQTADYSQADPIGCDEAFYIRGIRGGKLNIKGQNYKGRVLRVTEAQAGEFKTSLLNIESLVTGDINGASSATCGQSIFADVNGTAFGKIGFMWSNWDEYGPVFQDCIDVSFSSIEGGWRSGTGLEFRGCASIWGDKIAVGDEANTTPVLVKFTDSLTRRCWNISIDKMFIIGSVDGVVIENVGIATDNTTLRTGIKIGSLFTRNCSGRGLVVNNCANVDIMHDSENDGVSFESIGVFRDSEMNVNYRRSRAQSVIIPLGSGANLRIRGTVREGNTSSAAGVHSIDVASLENIWTEELVVSGSGVASLIKLASNNAFRMRGGSLTVSGSTVKFGGSAPRYADNVIGYVNKSRGQATIPNGQSAVVVTHGMDVTPAYVFTQVRNSDANGSRVRPSSIGPSTFAIQTISGNVASDSPVDWEAKGGNAP